MANRSQQAYEELLLLIRSGELAAGATVTEQELVDRLGVSRTPIREALARLAQHGLVNRLPGSSVVVEAMDLSRYLQLAEVRGVLESYAARLFVRNATEADMAVLEQLGRAVDEAAARKDREGETVAEQQFHEFLVRRSGNVELVALLERASLLTTFFSIPVPEAVFPASGPATAVHEDLVAAFRQRDPDEAERAMRRHIGIYSSPDTER